MGTYVTTMLRAAARTTASRKGGAARWYAKLMLAAVTGLGAMQAASAEDYPSRTVKIVVAYAPGGSTDAVARMFAQELSIAFGRTFIVENRAGGGTTIGTKAVARSDADGYTLFFGTNAFVITPLLQKKVGYDPVGDFAPIALTTVQSLGVIVNPRLELSTVQQLIDFARKNPDRVNFASSGNGSAQHLAGEAFKVAAGAPMTHVPYKGAGPALQDLLAGNVDVMFTSLVGNMEFIRDGRLRLLATTGSARGPATPNVPTVAESGVKGYAVLSWQGFFAPANTPQPVIDRLNSALRKIGESPSMRKKLADQGMELKVSSPKALGELVLRERDSYGDLIRKIGAQID